MANQNKKTVNQTYERIVFCDFDGTITTEETFIGMLKRYASDDYARVEKLVNQRRITLVDAVRRLVESIPSASFSDMQNYISNQAIRPGFEVLLDFLYDRDVPFVVISGGLLEQVQARLQPFEHRIHRMHAARIETDAEYIKVISPYENNAELVSKKVVMDTYNFKEAVAIGDGITDMTMAARADVVFARENLCRYLDKIGRTYLRWETFFDIRDALAEHWQEFEF